MGLSLLKGAVGNVWSWLISKVVWRLVLGVVGGIVLGPIVVLWAIVLGCARVEPWSVLMWWWLAVLVVRLSKISSYLAIGCDKGILTSGNSPEDVIAKILHEHLFSALHVLYDDVRNVVIRVLVEGVLVLHNI